MITEIFLVLSINHDGEWSRFGPVYLSKETAKSWVPFVKGANRGAATKTIRVKIERGRDGRVTQRCRQMLSDKFKIDSE